MAYTVKMDCIREITRERAIFNFKEPLMILKDILTHKLLLNKISFYSVQTAGIHPFQNVLFFRIIFSEDNDLLIFFDSYDVNIQKIMLYCNVLDMGL